MMVAAAAGQKSDNGPFVALVRRLIHDAFVVRRHTGVW
jgi:hypothetical protein